MFGDFVFCFLNMSFVRAHLGCVKCRHILEYSLTSCWLLSDCSEDASLRREGFWEELRDGTWETSKREKLGENAADAGCLPKLISPSRNRVCIWWLSSVTTPSPSLPTFSWCRTQMTTWRGVAAWNTGKKYALSYRTRLHLNPDSIAYYLGLLGKLHHFTTPEVLICNTKISTSSQGYWTCKMMCVGQNRWHIIAGR